MKTQKTKTTLRDIRRRRLARERDERRRFLVAFEALPGAIGALALAIVAHAKSRDDSHRGKGDGSGVS